MTYVNDHARTGAKAYRETTPGVPLEYRAGQFGGEIIDQDDRGGYTLAKRGDEQGWSYWEESTSRILGSWAQAVPSILHSDGKIYPILNKTLSRDSNYLGKTLVSTSALNDYTKVRNSTDDDVETGTTGLTAQCLNSEGYEYIFFASLGVQASIAARIAWNYDLVQDLSEGEILTYNSETSAWESAGKTVWIDWQGSTYVQFETAGNNTIFEIELVAAEHTRGTETRELYRAKTCIEDLGYAITHTQTVDRNTYRETTFPAHVPQSSGGGYLRGNISANLGNAIAGRLLSSALVESPWLNPLASKITTTIGATQKDNRIIQRIPGDWDLAGTGSFAYCERVETFHGVPHFFRPISPALEDRGQKKYNSSETLNNTTIATYTRR